MAARPTGSDPHVRNDRRRTVEDCGTVREVVPVVSTRDRLLNEHRAWREHQEELEQANAALESIREQGNREARERRLLEDEHRKKVERAALEGSEVPPDLPPPSVGLSNALRIAQARVTDLHSASMGVLAGIGAAVERRCYEEAVQVEAEVASLLGRLDRATEQMKQLLRIVHEARLAVESQKPRREPSRSGQTRHRLTVGELVEIVKDHRSALDPMPALGMQGLGGNKIQIDRGSGHEGSRTLVAQHPVRGRSD